jgi:hypothetical protein
LAIPTLGQTSIAQRDIPMKGKTYRGRYTAADVARSRLEQDGDQSKGDASTDRRLTSVCQSC